MLDSLCDVMARAGRDQGARDDQDATEGIRLDSISDRPGGIPACRSARLHHPLSPTPAQQFVSGGKSRLVSKIFDFGMGNPFLVLGTCGRMRQDSGETHDKASCTACKI